MGRREQTNASFKGCCVLKCWLCGIWTRFPSLCNSPAWWTAQTSNSRGISKVMILGKLATASISNGRVVARITQQWKQQLHKLYQELIFLHCCCYYLTHLDWNWNWFLKVQDPDNPSQSIYDSWVGSSNSPLVSKMQKPIIAPTWLYDLKLITLRKKENCIAATLNVKSVIDFVSSQPASDN